ncbi:MAG: hypothetical protein R8P61_29260 [Bacteroidia bacterium]|nr:hypothetical protein [Bacteroidia bacterium]
MDRQYSFLVLTDHGLHHERNPIYSLLPQLRKHPQCSEVHVASRTNSRNENFFQTYSSYVCEVLEIKEGFRFDESGKQFFDTGIVREVDSYDCILMRLPRPVERQFMEFVAKLDHQVVFINHPLGIEATSNKAFLTNFPKLCPPMKLCFSINEILKFASNFPIVLKPLKEYGGKGLLKIEHDSLFEGETEHPTIDYLLKHESYINTEGYLAMKFMKNVREGDKRIVLVGRNIMGASLRLPPEGSWICNVAQGGTSIAAELTPGEKEIIWQILPFLEERGVFIAGVDTLLGDHGKRVLSEINTLSVGGFLNIQEQSGQPVLARTVQNIIDYVHQKSRNR